MIMLFPKLLLAALVIFPIPFLAGMKQAEEPTINTLDYLYEIVEDGIITPELKQVREAIIAGDIEAVTQLLPGTPLEWALDLACSNDQPEIAHLIAHAMNPRQRVDLLMAKLASARCIVQRDKTLLFLIDFHAFNPWQLAAYLIECYGNASEYYQGSLETLEGTTVMHAAAIIIHLRPTLWRLARILVDEGASVLTPDFIAHLSPLKYAEQLGDGRLAKILLATAVHTAKPRNPRERTQSYADLSTRDKEPTQERAQSSPSVTHS